MDRETNYQQPAVDSFDEVEVLGDAPAVATDAVGGSQLPPHNI